MSDGTRSLTTRSAMDSSDGSDAEGEEEETRELDRIVAEKGALHLCLIECSCRLP